MTIYTYLITIGFILLSIIILVNTSRKVTSPVYNLVAAMKTAEGGEFSSIQSSDSTFIEMNELTEGFNRMISRISELMVEMQEEQIKLEQERYRVLQFQINPHFLYNTLDSIIWLCKEGRVEDTITMASSLISLFRIALSNARDFITIKDELEHATSYLTIQKMRFKGKFSFNTIVDEEINNFITNKLILQPLVENALYHGIQPSDHMGQITIIGYRVDDVVFLEVADNGVGIDPIKLMRLKNTLEITESNSDFGIGLLNVQKRIQFLFGKEYGITVHSEYNIGTTIKICIPVLKEVKDAENFIGRR